MSLLVCFFAIVYFLFQFSNETQERSALYLAIGFTVVYLYIPFMVYWRTKKLFLSEKKFSKPIHWTMDEQHAEMKSDIFEYQFKWSGVAMVSENKNAFLIYQNRQSANVIPKLSLLPAIQMEFRKLMVSIPGLKTELWIISKDNPTTSIQLASKTKRLFNGLLDTILFLLIFVLLTFLYVVIYVKLTPYGAEDSPIVTFIPYIAFLPMYGLYYFLSEYFFQRSPAKWITRTKVVTIDNDRPKARQILGRTLSRMIPFEFISFFVSPEGVHDLVSKTRVIQQVIKTSESE